MSAPEPAALEPAALDLSALDLSARAAIEDVVARYARAVDRSDWALLRSLYHPDALIDHGQYHGDVEGFVAFVASRRPGIVHTAHYVANCLIEPVGAGRAAVEVYGWAVQTFAEPSPLVPEGSAGVTFRSSYRCVDLLEPRAGEWRFLQTHLVLGDLEVQPHAEPPRRRAGPTQLPSMEDPLYRLLAQWRTG